MLHEPNLLVSSILWISERLRFTLVVEKDSVENAFKRTQVNYLAAMPIVTESYKPALFMRNGHVHTIYPALFRRPNKVQWQRRRMELPDGDFLDLDWWKSNCARLVVLGHGFEGNTTSTYVLAAAHLFHANGFDVLAWNHRSCSGEMNRLPRFYHNGVTEDLEHVLGVTKAYQELHYVGYSLGGNVMLKYLGDGQHRVPENFKSGVAISAPVDLPSCVVEMHKRRNLVYHQNFLRTLVQKVKIKHKMMPHAINSAHLNKVKTLTDFDTYYTAPLHGFESPADYYKKSSSLPFLANISIPTLLLQAQDDPMLGERCFPVEVAKRSAYFHFLQTRYGGHVAFTQPGSKWHWMEEVALEFAMRHSELNQ
jgi:predicted alpha/beta-fold hydrolase